MLSVSWVILKLSGIKSEVLPEVMLVNLNISIDWDFGNSFIFARICPRICSLFPTNPILFVYLVSFLIEKALHWV